MRQFKKASVQAFILPIVLFFIQLFALLGLYGLRMAKIEFTANRDEWQYEQYKRIAANALARVEDKLMTEKMTCTIPITSSLDFVKNPIEWWQAMSCSGNLAGNQYYYLLEFLGEDSCAVIVAADGKESAAEYYRVTLLLLPEKKMNAKILLQSTVAMTGKIPSCRERVHLVKVGRQMWRQLG